jgi:hypothetical protein
VGATWRAAGHEPEGGRGESWLFALLLCGVEWGGREGGFSSKSFAPLWLVVEGKC